MMNDKSIGVAQGLQYSYDGSIAYCGGFIDSYGRGVEIVISNRLARSLKKPLDVYWVSGSAMFIRKKLFEYVGGFSSELFMYHDEIDLCSRIRSLGFRCVCDPRVSYRHLRGGIVGRGINWITWYFTNRNRWLTAIRYLPSKYLFNSLLFSASIDFIANFFKSFRKSERNRILLQLRIYGYLLRNIKRELNIRSIYSSSNLKDLDRYIVKIPNPLIKENLLEKIALIKVLSNERI